MKKIYKMLNKIVFQILEEANIISSYTKCELKTSIALSQVRACETTTLHKITRKFSGIQKDNNAHDVLKYGFIMCASWGAHNA